LLFFDVFRCFSCFQERQVLPPGGNPVDAASVTSTQWSIERSRECWFLIQTSVAGPPEIRVSMAFLSSSDWTETFGVFQDFSDRTFDGKDSTQHEGCMKQQDSVNSGRNMVTDREIESFHRYTTDSTKQPMKYDATERENDMKDRDRRLQRQFSDSDGYRRQDRENFSLARHILHASVFSRFQMSSANLRLVAGSFQTFICDTWFYFSCRRRSIN